MSEARHTPGPWFWTPENRNGGYLHDASGDTLILEYTTADDGLHGTAEDKRLIAAAPKLLHALEAFNFTEIAILGGTADTLILHVPIKVLQDAAAAIAEATRP